MATLGALALSYGDWARRVDDKGKMMKIIEILSQTNEILTDMVTLESNTPTGHKTTVRTGLPQATWRQLYQGVAATKSTTAQVTDGIGMLETYSQVDKALADLNGETARFRASEDMAFLEGMNQQMASTLFYGNTSINPEKFMGLAPRFNTVSTATAQNAVNVIDAGGTGSTNTSMWLVCWGPRTVHGIFPAGQAGGLKMEDKGTVRPGLDANNRQFEAYTTHFKWDNGLSVRDWRYVVRICNIDVTQLAGNLPPNLIVALIRAVHRLPTQPASAGPVQTSDSDEVDYLMAGRCAFYANRTVRTWLDIQAVNKSNVLLRFEEWAGKPTTTFRGVPIRTCDALLNTEARIV